MRRLTVLTLALLIAFPSFGAVAAGTIWEVRTAGSDTNGGGYVATGTDMSIFDNKNAAACTSCQSATVNISTLDGVTAGTTTVTSATGNYSSALIGNIVYIAGGTGTITGVWKQVLTVPGATSFTVDSSTGLTAGTGVTVNIGGALASPGQAGGNRIAGNTVYIKAGTYSLTSATPNIAGGVISDTTAGTSITWEGYQGTRGDLGTAPILQASGISSVTLFATTGAGTAGALIRNLTIDCNSLTTTTGLTAGRAASFYKILVKNCTTVGISNSAAVQFTRTRVTGSTTGFVGGSNYTCLFCEADTNTGIGFGCTATCQFSYSLAYGNTGASSDGFDLAPGSVADHLVAYANGRDGIRLGGAGASSSTVTNSIAESNTGFGFGGAATTRPTAMLINCGVFGNSGGNVDTSNITVTSVGLVTGSGSFFTSAATGDFSLNTTSGRGAAARAAGTPGAYLSGTTTGYTDIGGAQHQDTAKGAATP